MQTKVSYKVKRWPHFRLCGLTSGNVSRKVDARQMQICTEVDGVDLFGGLIPLLSILIIHAGVDY